MSGPRLCEKCGHPYHRHAADGRCADCAIAALETAKASELERDLAAVLNRHSQENASNTPDFILAQYLLGCLAAWNAAVQQRET